MGESTPYGPGVSATVHEAGRVADDGLLHAVQKKITGNVALCGAGRITQLVPGRFTVDGELSCASCVQQVQPATG